MKVDPNISAEKLAREMVEIAKSNQRYILDQELQRTGVPLNYYDENGKYVFEYADGTILAANLKISVMENIENHKKIMGWEWIPNSSCSFAGQMEQGRVHSLAD